MKKEQQSGLRSMLSPKSIAIIGASGDKSKISNKPIANLKEIGYEGEVYLVNPKYDKIEDYLCYQDIESLPPNIDLALISVSAPKVIGILKKLYERNVKSVVIFSSGYSEIGEEGAMLERELTDFSMKNDIPICGPNSLGITNFKEKTIVSFSSLKYGNYDPVAFITQSGAMGSLTYTLAKEIGLGFHYFVSSGNEACVDFFDYVRYFAEEEEIKVIGGYLEGARDFQKMDSAIQACHEAEKPIVLMKVGNSAKGAEAASSHTASIAGNAEIYKHYLKHNNIIRVSDEEELTDTISMFNKTQKPDKPGGIAIVTQSGGAGIVMTDQSEVKNLPIAELSDETKIKLKHALPKFASVKNPIDVTAQVNQSPDQIIEAVNIVMQDDAVSAVVLYLQMTDEPFLPILPKLSEIAKNANKIFVFCWAGIQERTKEDLLKQKNICWIPNPTRTINALANVMNYYKSMNEIRMNKQIPLIHEHDKEIPNLEGNLNEWEGKILLQKYGVPVPRGIVINNEEDLNESLIHYPLVMKALSSEIEHKSDFGLVRLNIHSMLEAKQAFTQIVVNKQTYCHEKKLDGVLVEEMAPAGVEVIVGGFKDSIFGPCIMFGLGGIFVEIIKDVVVLPAPLTKENAVKMVKSIKSFKVLQGERGTKTYDIDALANSLVSISELIADYQETLTEFEINPLIVHETGKGVTAVDALAVSEKKNVISK
jgi:acetate---CoA ligase (ADP-forming)